MRVPLPHRSGAERPGRRGTTGGRPPPRSRLGNRGGEAPPRARPLAHLGQVPGPRTAVAAPPLRPAPLRSDGSGGTSRGQAAPAPQTRRPGCAAPVPEQEELPRPAQCAAAARQGRTCRRRRRVGPRDPGAGCRPLPGRWRAATAARGAPGRRGPPRCPAAGTTALREGWREKACLSEPFKQR